MTGTGSPVQQWNCHPFRHGRWLWMHNGFVGGFAAVKRDLVLAVDESLFPEIKGRTDTEVLFYLALSLGLQDDRPARWRGRSGSWRPAGGGAVSSTRSRARSPPATGRACGCSATPAKAGRGRCFTRDVRLLREQYPDREILREVSDDTRLVVSEPIGDLPGAWIEMPEASYGVVSKGGDQLLPFAPSPSQSPVRLHQQGSTPADSQARRRSCGFGQAAGATA